MSANDACRYRVEWALDNPPDQPAKEIRPEDRHVLGDCFDADTALDVAWATLREKGPEAMVVIECLGCGSWTCIGSLADGTTLIESVYGNGDVRMTVGYRADLDRRPKPC